ncbi:MAG TPA: hypothetical protein PLI08_02915, partial [Bacteroidia bacterium]|nr:hypothetical protein [Bacteroidia bacterium]
MKGLERSRVIFYSASQHPELLPACTTGRQEQNLPSTHRRPGIARQQEQTQRIWRFPAVVQECVAVVGQY